MPELIILVCGDFYNNLDKNKTIKFENDLSIDEDLTDIEFHLEIDRDKHLSFYIDYEDINFLIDHLKRLKKSKKARKGTK